MFFSAILRPRRGGKSHDLAQIAKKNPNAIVVTHTMAMKLYFTEQFGVNPDRVVTLDELLSGRCDGMVKGPLLFDNFEYMFEALLGRRLHPDSHIVISATGTNL